MSEAVFIDFHPPTHPPFVQEIADSATDYYDILKKQRISLQTNISQNIISITVINTVDLAKTNISLSAENDRNWSSRHCDDAGDCVSSQGCVTKESAQGWKLFPEKEERTVLQASFKTKGTVSKIRRIV